MAGAFLRRRDRTVRSLRVGHYSSAVNKRDRADCFRAFMNNNWLGGFVFLGLVAEYALRSGWTEWR